MDIVYRLENIFKLLFQGDDSFKLKEIIPRNFNCYTEKSQYTDSGTDVIIDTDKLGKTLDSLEHLLNILQDNYESIYGIFIEYIFHELQNLFETAAHNNTLSSIPFSRFLKVITMIIELSISHSCVLDDLTCFYTCNVNNVERKHNMDCDNFSFVVEELTWRLKIISVIYERISKNSHLSAVKELCRRMDAENECKLYSQLLNSNSDIIVAQTLLNVIPNFIEFHESCLVIQYFWDRISKSNDINTSKTFVILCYLSEYYFTSKNKELLSRIFSDKNYWLLLQSGFISADSAIRKQALYLLKRSLEYVMDNNMCVNDKICYKFYMEKLQIESFKELCVIVEYLEEKQIHIIQPIFDVIKNFIENNVKNNLLDKSWIMVVLQRMLCHDNIKIIRCGISNLLKIPVESYKTEIEIKNAVKLLISSLKCTEIYMNDLLGILNELQSYFETSSKSTNGEMYFKLLIKEISNVQWSSEGLFCIIYCLKLIKLQKYWQKEELELVKNLIVSGKSANHYTYIRSGMLCQLLWTSMNLFDTLNISLNDLCSFLNIFKSKTSLCRGSLLWENVVNWMKDSYSMKDFENFIVKCISDADGRNTGRIILLTYDAQKSNQSVWNIGSLLRKISTSFLDVHARPYCDVNVQDFNLSVICGMIKESFGEVELLDYIIPYLPDIILYIQSQTNTVHHIRHYERIGFLLDSLDIILDFDKKRLSLITITLKWFENISESLMDSFKEYPLKKFTQIKVLNSLIDYNPRFRLNGCIEEFLKTRINSPLEKTSEEISLSKDLQSLWGRMNSEYLRGNWKLLSDLIDLGIGSAEFVDLCFQGLDIGGYVILPPLMTAVTKVLPSLSSEAKFRNLIDHIWSVIMERKKNEEFISLIKTFVEMIFQLDLIKSDVGILQDMLTYYTEKLFSDNTTKVVNMFVKHIQSLEIPDVVPVFYLDFLSRALLYGQLQKRDERLISEICSIIEEENLSPLRNDFITNSEVRARAVGILLKLNPDNEMHCEFAAALSEGLIRMEENLSKNKTRYFADSNVHRVKQRLMQALLVLEEFMPKEKSENLWKWVTNKIILENNQPSVRYLQEWLILRIMKRNPHFKERIWSYFDEGLDKRTGSLCSLISIIYHTVKLIPSDVIASWMDTAIQTFLPYCMAQHFSVRLYAQVTLQKLLTLAEERGIVQITDKYNAVRKSLNKSIESGNAIKNCAKMQDDFYFTVFDPIVHYSIETIFCDIPRLTNVRSDEWICNDVFLKCGVIESCGIPLRNVNESLKLFTSGSWFLDRSKEDTFVDDSDTKDGSELSNFQKKIIPIKCLVPEWEELHQSLTYLSKKDHEKDGLIVVASLVDRIPNLGGLCRTCEVFGASELVVNSLRFIEDKQFQSLSVTAEKWIPISEVKSFHLSNYLMKMKENGYTLLAAEQTINSQPLQSVKFPKKSVLLLGNEKEGIPSTLLPLMDICVEIPQFGVIRSLNVHVTGALFIWEYAKQHRFSS